MLIHFGGLLFCFRIGSIYSSTARGLRSAGRGFCDRPRACARLSSRARFRPSRCPTVLPWKTLSFLRLLLSLRTLIFLSLLLPQSGFQLAKG